MLTDHFSKLYKSSDWGTANHFESDPFCDHHVDSSAVVFARWVSHFWLLDIVKKWSPVENYFRSFGSKIFFRDLPLTDFPNSIIVLASQTNDDSDFESKSFKSSLVIYPYQRSRREIICSAIPNEGIQNLRTRFKSLICGSYSTPPWSMFELNSLMMIFHVVRFTLNLRS